MSSPSSISRRPHDAAFFARLRRHELHAQNLLGERRGFVGRFRELHSAGFAAPARMNLRFHHNDGRAQPLRGGRALRLS